MDSAAGGNQQQKGTVIVAVGFDDALPAVISTAVSLARRFDAELRFIHTILPTEQMGFIDYSAATMVVSPLAILPCTDELIKETSARLEQDVLAKIPAGIRKSGVVATGYAIQTIAAEAVSRRASLILAGCDEEGYGAFSEGLSTAVGLMHEAPLPVLVVSKACPVDFTRSDCRILLADDLQPATKEAARKAFELATRLGGKTSVRQFHVHGDFREVLKESWQTSWSEAKALLPSAQNVSLEAALEQDYTARLTSLAGQGQPWRSAAEKAGVKVALDVRTGKVARELHEAIVDGNPDVLVFGRHRLLRARPFLIGRMPLRAMLQEKRAVLLVPSETELYARMAFPAGQTTPMK